MGSPAIYTPLTRAQMAWFSNQGKICGELEMDYYRCASRVGMNRAYVDCNREYADFHECMTRNKQFQRYCAMQEERRKQGRPYPETQHASSTNVV